jgi:hypothetical protein
LKALLGGALVGGMPNPSNREGNWPLIIRLKFNSVGCGFGRIDFFSLGQNFINGGRVELLTPARLFY